MVRLLGLRAIVSRRIIKKAILAIVLVIVIGFTFSHSVFAQQGTWQFDAEVTIVGKNAERARQLIFWIFTHPPSYNVSVLADIWGISRNIVYALFILVLAIIGLGYIISKRGGSVGPIFNGISSPLFGLTIPTLFYRVIILLVYVTFSYVIVLGLIQSSEIASRFFIKQFQGCRLFNITFTGDPANFTCDLSGASADETPANPNISKDIEKNYLEFVGYKDPNVLSQESATTGLLLVRMTTLTYNIMAVVFILRQVILWFLLMLSPFLAILLPFMFIRNTGYIWIGVFFQWLFYGPLVALFIGGLAKVWESGIPYAFDFSRVNQPGGQVFPTAINILYGGPAQVLSPTNSANYIDTYVEYIIALVMLWTAIFLPWLLLRIFRDYCCDILKQNNASILSAFDKLRGGGPLPKPTPPSGPSPSIQLPFREPIAQLQKTTIDRLKDVSQTNTNELTRELSFSISSLTQVARYEMNTEDRKKVVENLNRIANPYIIPNQKDKQTFITIKKELETRAKAGDKQAALILAAAEKKFTTPAQTPVGLIRELPEITKEEIVNNISNNIDISREKIREILTKILTTSTQNQFNVIAQTANISANQVQQLLNQLPQYTPTGVSLTTLLAENPQIIEKVAKRTGLTQEKVKEVINRYTELTLSSKERIERIAKETTISSENVRQVIETLPQIITTTTPEFYKNAATNTTLVEKVSEKTKLSKEKISEILNTISESTVKESTAVISKDITKDKETISHIVKETNQEESVVSKVVETTLNTVPGLTISSIPSVINNTETINTISQKTNTAPVTVKEIISKLTEVSTQTSTKDVISETAKKTNESEKTVKDILEQTTQSIPEFAPEMITSLLVNTKVLTNLSQDTGFPETTVKKILEKSSTIPSKKKDINAQIEDVATKTETNKEEVKNVLSTVSAYNLEKPEAVKQAKAPRRTAVSVEDYEEVKNMWMNHYKLTEVPKTESIKTRGQWLSEDIRYLTNTLNLMMSLNPKNKEKGMKQVASILPFLLLGGFSNVETVIYLKAKLQAAKSILASLEEREKLKEEVKKEEEETLVEIKQGQKQEEEKTMQAKKVQELPLPETVQQQNNQQPNQQNNVNENNRQ